MKIALGLEYDGSRFAGWQSQREQRTVQDVLETALTCIAAKPVRTHCAGRTDAGVHAAVQVVHFETDVNRPISAWVRGVNALLPDAVAVKWAVEAVPDFHARFSTRARGYRYLLLNRPVRPGLLAGKIGWFHRALDAEKMAFAAQALVGAHDFSSFRAAACQAASPVKTLTSASVTRVGELITFEFEANAFLHHMVRNMLGALVAIGKGSRPPEWIGELLALRDRKLAAPTFPPDGLYLSMIEYPDGLGLPNGGMIRAAAMETFLP
ncbi:MAG: tRNA pseudouridine(38-40) synthase TruA [Betaproteobacteria bacterium]|nr:tRNA pseudouridine(38-40) synthase TruA [Betaproteobacteria bacterium]